MKGGRGKAVKGPEEEDGCNELREKTNLLKMKRDAI